MKKNPYTLLFGKEPSQMISRTAEITSVLDSFQNAENPQQVYILTGVRGSGKTVMMTEISRKLKENREWMIIELNPEKDLLQMLGAALSAETQWAQLFQSADINLSFFSFGLAVKGAAPITDIEIALAKMLEVLKKHGKKVLITIDEAVNTKEMRTFVSAFQILIRKDLPVFLLITGLYENINNLQNEKSLTFLYRAPKIELKPLNLRTIAKNYQNKLSVNEETSLKMARLTRGYSFAFQVLCYFTFENGGWNSKVLSDYRQYLNQYSYEKIWTELSDKDKFVVYGIAKTSSRKISEIRSFLKLETNQFNLYRMRLIRKGIVNGDRYGYLSFTLPLFEDFAVDTYETENDTYETL